MSTPLSMTLTRLYLGRSMDIEQPDGATVTLNICDDMFNEWYELSWANLIDCTIYQGKGIFNGKEESCTILEIIHDSPQSDHFITDLARGYKLHFKQECVLRTDQPVTATFI